MANLSTFGSVLDWVSEQLKKVEKSMVCKPQTNLAIKYTHELIDKLIEHDQELAKNFEKTVVDTEYKTLVDIIQNHKTVLIEEDIDKTIRMLRESGIAEPEIIKIKQRMQKTLNSSQK
ncbi:hypothetical protein I8751_09955 [Nostocaceae cyanobacterium CENA357]|uniref:Uncharacterized protein n=1 Tax=Atlanticothrix silvestris CENA357 TaxID=1725252 RepID=A0A8J7HC11_9CYAN|nr:hypothetical protein [Atlanticothrix silvestris]MBH8552689.1 hypothetical protein [Atlanticothrix silvestris CENA357]